MSTSYESLGQPNILKYDTKLETIDDVESELLNSSKKLKEIQKEWSVHEYGMKLQQVASQSMDHHNLVALALLYDIITGLELDLEKVLDHLILIVRDSYEGIVQKIYYLTIDHSSRLMDNARRRIMWLLDRLIQQNAPNIENICLGLLRQIRSGSDEDLLNVKCVLKLLKDNEKWLVEHPLVISSTVYRFLRLIHEHWKKFEQLQREEIQFVIRLLRNHFSCCIDIGRDLIRILQMVSRIPEFENFCIDLMENNIEMSGNSEDFMRLLSQPTPKKYLKLLIPFDLELELVFVMENVKLGKQKPYQQWILKKHMLGVDNDEFLVDIIRYICVVFHPPNSLLQSDMVPRWAMIGWLLKCIKTNYGAANAKLALFYDWMFWNRDKDTIMSIEPAMLVMYHSMPKYKNITSTLLDFLIRVPDLYYPPLKHTIKNNIVQGFRAHQAKGVIRSLSTLFENPCLDSQLREMLYAAFGEALLVNDENPKRGDTESSSLYISKPKETVPMIQISGTESFGLKEFPVDRENSRIEPKSSSVMINREIEEHDYMESYEPNPAVVEVISQILDLEDGLQESWDQGQLDFVYNLASSSTPYQILRLMVFLSNGLIKLFSLGTFTDILVGSLKWESYEQTNFWLLVGAELKNRSPYVLKCIDFVLDRLNLKDHSESYLGLFNLLNDCKPSFGILHKFFCRNLQGHDSSEAIPDWNTLSQTSMLLNDSASINYWICSVLSNWLTHYQSEVQLILSEILLKEDLGSLNKSMIYTLDLIYLWLLYKNQRILLSKNSLIQSHDLAEKIQDLLSRYNLVERYPFMSSLIEKVDGIQNPL